MLRAALHHNPNAGKQQSPGELVRAIEEIGWPVAGVFCDIERALEASPDVVVVAGGDGTVGRVAKRLAHTGVALAIVPTGTVNNVARALGVPVGAEAVSGLAHACELWLDLGAVDGGRFIEGFGVGVFAHLIAERASGADKAPARAHDLLARELERYVPARVQLEIDGRDASGEYLVAAVLNGRTVGPALCLAPGARVDDGQLDVALACPEHRGEWIERLRAARDDSDVWLPPFETARASHVRVRADGLWSHVDDEARELAGDINVEVVRGAVRVLVPR